MDSQDQKKFTEILAAAGRGDTSAAAALWEFVYDELHRLAERKMAGAPPGQTLQPTALVHEAFLRLAGDGKATWENRAHFFGAAARAMRNVLVDHARRKGRSKRGAGLRRVPISRVTPAFEARALDILALDEALSQLERTDPRAAETVILRFFAGLTIEDAAKTLGVSTATVEREWTFARAWLFRRMERDGD